jgi:hypothetical protein
MKSLILLFLSLSITKIYAQVPNQFSSGDSVSAEKINENFSYASKRLVLKNNGTFIGDIMCNENSCSLITTKGYLVPNLINIFETSVSFGSGTVYYLRDNSWNAPNCPSTAPQARKRSYFTNSIVIGNNGGIYIYNKDTSSTNGVTDYIYATDGSSCSGGYNQSSYDLVAVTNNDESITGFPNTIGTLSVSYE